MYVGMCVCENNDYNEEKHKTYGIKQYNYMEIIKFMNIYVFMCTYNITICLCLDNNNYNDDCDYHIVHGMVTKLRLEFL